MTVIQSFESLLSTFLGGLNPDLITYLATVFSIMVFCGMVSLVVGMFTRRAGRYIGIACITAVIAVTLNYVGLSRYQILPEGTVFHAWF